VDKYGGYVVAVIGDRALVAFDGGLPEVCMIDDLTKVV
jgi:class 3 adenylate cyclase